MGESSGAWESMFRITMGGSWVISLACQIAIIAVIATVVRRHRPDAWTSLLAWAIAGTLVWFISPALSFFTVRFGADGGVGGIYKAQVVNQLLGIPMHLAVIVLLIRGLVKLAQPAPKVEVDSQLPYR